MKTYENFNNTYDLDIKFNFLTREDNELFYFYNDVCIIDYHKNTKTIHINELLKYEHKLLKYIKNKFNISEDINWATSSFMDMVKRSIYEK